MTKACKEKYPDKNPMDPDNKIMKVFILECIYRAIDIQNDDISVSTIDTKMRGLNNSAEKINTIITTLHQK